MKKSLFALGLFCAMACCLTAVAGRITIPPNTIDPQVVYWGANHGEFERIGEVDFTEAVRATPESEDARKKKVGSGSAEYWILMNSASERVLRAVLAVARSEKYDLVARAGGLKALGQNVNADDITKQVIEHQASVPIARAVFMPAPDGSIPIGSDIAVVAMKDGVISAIQCHGDKDVTVVLCDDSGNRFHYLQLAACSLKEGDAVKMGQIIGTTRNTEAFSSNPSRLRVEMAAVESADKNPK